MSRATCLLRAALPRQRPGPPPAPGGERIFSLSGEGAGARPPIFAHILRFPLASWFWFRTPSEN